MSYWRDRVAPLIAEVLRATTGQPEAAIRKALRDAYPFGERTNWVYKVWCSEVAIQRGIKPKLGTRLKPIQKRAPVEVPEQVGLFEAKGTDECPTT